ncbi:ABC transporter ATP-binding protein [Bacillus rubiinfantis]|uniref:ABC transporter ATP-binding protein n=1 Tax=Bacillus rubiinfantis TaxID=1499680 RepID=UPI0005A943AD|nr:ABC transporter transmembrane domain-containing protein [Bacillus rubiinfantis]
MNEKMELTGSQQRRVLFRLLSYTKPHRKMIGWALLLLVLTTLGDIVLPLLIATFIDDYLQPGRLEFKPLLLLASAYIAIQVVKSILLFFQLVKFQEIALLIIQQLRIDVFAKVQTLGLKYFDQTPGGSIVSRVTNDTEAIKDMFVTVIATFIQSGFLLFGIFITMYLLNVKLALLCTVIIPIIFFVMVLYRKWSSRYYLIMREKLAQLNAKLSESLQGMAIVQVFRQEKRLRREFAAINGQHYNAQMKNIKIDGLLLRPAIDLIYILALIIVLGYFGLTSFTQTVQLGIIFAFVNYLDRFFEPVNQMMMQLSLYQQAIVAGSRVFRLLDEKETAPVQNEDSSIVIGAGKIEFKNVSFSYDGKRDVLKHISFTAHPGETVALVGHTGSGKSSIINLLMRFYEFERGDILIDNQSIKQFPRSEIREKIGLVLQDPFLFYGTVKDNIRLYHDEITDKQIIEAAKFVQAHSFIERLQDGYNHQVVERGTTFSSGQRQLIAFARTIAYNPKILVLDEATANIDTETEEAIQLALAQMRKGRTTIAIAHRLSTIQDADLILVLHKGEIIERGTHQQLLAEKGLYHKMFLLQNGAASQVENIAK